MTGDYSQKYLEKINKSYQIFRERERSKSYKSPRRLHSLRRHCSVEPFIYYCIKFVYSILKAIFIGALVVQW